MAYPVLETSAVTNGSSSGTSHDVNLPSGIAAGDLIVVLARAAVAGAIGWPDATWHEVFDASDDAADDQMALAWHKATGSEGSTIAVTHGSGKLAAVAIRVSGAMDPDEQPPEFSTVAVGSSTTPNPTGCTPTGGAKDYLWVWLGGWEGEQTSPPSGNPTNYSGGIGANTGTSGLTTTNCRVAMSFYSRNADTEDPGSWTISVTDEWTAYTMAIHPSAARGHMANDEPGLPLLGAPRIASAGLAAIATLSACLSLGLANAHQDDPAGSLYNLVDEDYWNSPIPKLPARPRFERATGASLQATGPPFAPADDGWSVPLPWPETAFRRLLLFDDDAQPGLRSDGEEWGGSLSVPARTSPFVKLPLGDPEELPAASLHGQPDEDFWQSGVAPVPGTMFVALPLGDPEELPAAALHGVVEEDYFWRLPAPPLPILPHFERRAGASLSSTGPLPETAPPEEDYWQNPVPPVLLSYWQRLPIGDRDEILHGPVGEDYWNPAVIPTPPRVVGTPGQDDDYVPPPTFVPEEDFWTSQVHRTLPHFERAAGAALGATGPQAPPPDLAPDEDHWQGGIALPTTWPWPTVWRSNTDIQAKQVVPADEDHWRNWVAPVLASFYQRLPYLPDAEEIPAASLRGLPEELHPVALASPPWPVPGTMNPQAVSPPWLGEMQERVAPPLPVVDEDFWQNPVAPVAGSLWQPLPLGDPEELPAGVLHSPEEDYWQNPTAPVPGAMFVRLPFLDPDEIPTQAWLLGEPVIYGPADLSAALELVNLTADAQLVDLSADAVLLTLFVRED